MKKKRDPKAGVPATWFEWIREVTGMCKYLEELRQVPESKRSPAEAGQERYFRERLEAFKAQRPEWPPDLESMLKLQDLPGVEGACRSRKSSRSRGSRKGSARRSRSSKPSRPRRSPPTVF